MSKRLKRHPRLGENHKPTSRVLRKVVEQLSKKYSKDEASGVSLFSDSVFSDDRPFAKSGLLSLDWTLCRGKGFPTGIIEIYGPESSGKTAVVEKALAEAQKRGWYTAIFPPEYSMQARRVKSVGIDGSKLVVLEAETIEDFHEELRDFVSGIRKEDADTPILVGWDSIAATPTRAELENKKGLEASDMAGLARQISKFFRRLVRWLFKNKVCLLCINQTRDSMKSWGNRETTSGGRALRFYAWIRCRISRIEVIKDKDGREKAFLCELRTTKNKVAPPFRSCKLYIDWSHGINVPLSDWEYFVESGVFHKKGLQYSFRGERLSRKMFPEFYAQCFGELQHDLKKLLQGEDVGSIRVERRKV